MTIGFKANNDGSAAIQVNGTDRVNVGTSGNVGIGAVSPASPLDIGKTGTNVITAFLTTGVDDANFRIGTINGVAGTAGTSMGKLGMFYVGAGEAATIDFIRGAGATDGAIAFRSAGSEKLRISASGGLSTGDTLQPGFFCRAWVNFNGTGTVAIRASDNVSSITDGGVGTYAVNFTTAMPDANFAAVATQDIVVNHGIVVATSRTTAGVTLSTVSNGAVTDMGTVSVAIFR